MPPLPRWSFIPIMPGESKTSLELLQRDGAQRIGAAEANRAGVSVPGHLGRCPVVLFARQPVGVAERLALVGEAVADREHDRPLDTGRIQFPDQRRAVSFGKLHDRREVRD